MNWFFTYLFPFPSLCAFLGSFVGKVPEPRFQHIPPWGMSELETLDSAHGNVR